MRHVFVFMEKTEVTFVRCVCQFAFIIESVVRRKPLAGSEDKVNPCLTVTCFSCPIPHSLGLSHELCRVFCDPFPLLFALLFPDIQHFGACEFFQVEAGIALDHHPIMSQNEALFRFHEVFNGSLAFSQKKAIGQSVRHVVTNLLRGLQAFV